MAFFRRLSSSDGSADAERLRDACKEEEGPAGALSAEASLVSDTLDTGGIDCRSLFEASGIGTASRPHGSTGEVHGLSAVAICISVSSVMMPRLSSLGWAVYVSALEKSGSHAVCITISMPCGRGSERTCSDGVSFASDMVTS